MAVAYSNTPCLHLQIAVEQATQESGYQVSDFGISDFLHSQENKSKGLVTAQQLNQLVDTQGRYLSSDAKGKFAVSYRKQKCEKPAFTATGDCATLTAGTGEDVPDMDEFTASKTIGFKVTVKHSEYRDKCYTSDMAKERIIEQYRDVVLAEFEEYYIQQIAANIGKYHSQAGGTPNSGDTPASATIINDGGTFNPAVVSLLKSAFKRKKIKNLIKFFGDTGGMIAQGLDALDFTIGNMQNGTDASKLSAKMFGVSDQLNTVLDDEFPTATGDHILGIPFGAYQVFEWFSYVGRFEKLFGQNGLPFEQKTMPLFGMKWDVNMERTKCDDIFEFTKTLGVYTQPLVACEDNLALNFLALCGAPNCTSNAALRTI